MNRFCAFSTADDAYIPKAAASLLSIRRWNKDTPLFIFTSHASWKTKRFLKRHNITCVELNLRKTFTKSWEYPLECFYLFAGPEYLLQKYGFSHSLYIDGDIYCNKNPFNLPLSSVKTIAGVSHGTIGNILGDDTKKAAAIWQKTVSSAKTERLQTGVLYFNNSQMNKIGLLNQAGDLFRKALKEDIPRKGDDSLFALFQYVYPELNYQVLPREFNVITSVKAEENQWLTHDDNLIKESVFYHFTNFAKPWDTTSQNFPNATYKYFARQWQLRSIDMLDDKALKKYFPNIYAQLSDDHLHHFYWYPSENVGDLVTPYYLKNVAHLANVPERLTDEETLIQLDSKEHRKAQYIVSTGSVIRLCGPNAQVFGSGIRSEGQEVHPSFVRSVRGPLTRQRFIAEGYECPPIYGDPGLLMPLFYKPRVRKKYKLGIIPHFTEYTQVKKMYENQSDVLVINLGTGDLEAAIRDILSCEQTVSSSLHGLVFSHAYAVPTRRIIFSDKIFGDGTKFADYYGGVTLTPLTPIDASGFSKKSIAQLASAKKELLGDFSQQQLLDAMFFNEHGLRPSARYPY